MSTMNKRFSLFFYLKKQNNEKRETAIELFHQHLYDLVLLSAGIEPASEIKLRKLFALQNPDIKIIQHGAAAVVCWKMK